MKVVAHTSTYRWPRPVVFNNSSNWLATSRVDGSYTFDSSVLIQLGSFVMEPLVVLLCFLRFDMSAII